MNRLIHRSWGENFVRIFLIFLNIFFLFRPRLVLNNNSSPVDTPTLDYRFRFCRSFNPYAVPWRNLAVVGGVRPVVDVALECFRRASCSTSIGLDVAVSA